MGPSLAFLAANSLKHDCSEAASLPHLSGGPAGGGKKEGDEHLEKGFHESDYLYDKNRHDDQHRYLM